MISASAAAPLDAVNPPTAGMTAPVVACRRCPNDTRNPTVVITDAGLCLVCQSYTDGYRRDDLDREREQLLRLVGTGTGSWDAMVGLSGGKDSTAALVRARQLGFSPLAFTFDSGYYPAHIITRARAMASLVGVEHHIVDLRAYVRESDRESYRLTAELFDEPDSPGLAARFRHWYIVGRRRYSVRHGDPMPYPRTCQLCRRLVVRAYHREASRRGVRVVLLGTNEWVGLSQDPACGAYRFSAVRALRPTPDDDPVYVVHLPFLLSTTIAETRAVLRDVGWRPPTDEALVETNANSCLLSRAAEDKATRMLGFHPDTSRLAREVTVGFLAREQATAALRASHPYPSTVREVLARAGLLP